MMTETITHVFLREILPCLRQVARCILGTEVPKEWSLEQGYTVLSMTLTGA